MELEMNFEKNRGQYDGYGCDQFNIRSIKLMFFRFQIIGYSIKILFEVP